MTAYIKMWGTKTLLVPCVTHWINLLRLSFKELLGDPTRLNHARPGCIPSGCWHRSNRPDKKDPAETTRHWQPFNTAEQAVTHCRSRTHAQKCTPPPLRSSHSLSHSLTHSTHRQAGQLPTIISPLCCQRRLFSWAALPPSSSLHPPSVVLTD